MRNYYLTSAWTDTWPINCYVVHQQVLVDDDEEEQDEDEEANAEDDENDDASNDASTQASKRGKGKGKASGKKRKKRAGGAGRKAKRSSLSRKRSLLSPLPAPALLVRPRSVVRVLEALVDVEWPPTDTADSPELLEPFLERLVGKSLLSSFFFFFFVTVCVLSKRYVHCSTVYE
jgi:hypothetical protein